MTNRLAAASGSRVVLARNARPRTVTGDGSTVPSPVLALARYPAMIQPNGQLADRLCRVLARWPMTGRGWIHTVDLMQSPTPSQVIVRPPTVPVTGTDPTVPEASSRWTAPIVAARGLVHGYDQQTVLEGVDCDVAAGDTLALTGPSGSGRTTLLHLLAGITTPWQGRIDLAPRRPASTLAGRPAHVAEATPTDPALDAGGDITSMDVETRSTLRRTRFGLVFQSGQLLDELTCVENVALPLLAANVGVRDARRAAAALFAPLGLDGLEERRPGEVSGGQRQRVALARAMVTRSDVLFADEPTGALDARTGRALLDTLFAVQRETGMALVIVTHDPEVSRRCDRVLRLSEGRIVGGVSEVR